MSLPKFSSLLLLLGRLLNMKFKDPFHTLSHPTSIQTTLPAAALFAKFDPSGRFLATGRHNGAAEIWDLETKNDIRCLDGHVKPVTSVECVTVFRSLTC